MSKELASIENLAPIFIVGMARSGTTLLQSILNSHPNIAIPRETTFFYLVEEYLSSNVVSSFSKNEVEKFWQWYTKKRKFTYLGLEKNNIKNNFRIFKDSNNFKNVLDSVMLENLEKKNKKRWGEKTPGHEEYLDNIFELYPNAKVIFMIRDPRSVYASLNNVPWNNQFVSVIIKRWNKSVKKLKTHSNDKRVLLITYEELVTNTIKTTIDICEFIGEKFTDKMINDRVNDIPDKNDKSWTTTYEKNVISKEIDGSSLTKWKTQLSKLDISVIETFTDQEIFNKFYKKLGKKLNLFDRIKYFILKVYYYLNTKMFRNVK